MENITTSKRILMTDKLFEKLGFKQRNGYFAGSNGYKYEKTCKIGRGHKFITERISVKKENKDHYLIRHEFMGEKTIDGVETRCAKYGPGSEGCHSTISFFDELCDYLYSRQSIIVMEDDFFIS